jgi:Kef-type K+ transport system membrane component KefB
MDSRARVAFLVACALLVPLAASASPDAGIDAALDAGIDAALDAGIDAGPPDAGPPDAPEPDAPPPILVAVPDERPPPLPEAERPGVALRAILGLLAILALAYLAALPGARRLEETLGLSSVIAAGFPFVALGVLARHPAIGILDDHVLHVVAPLLDFGLGWIGFLVGIQFDVRALDRLPDGTGRVVVGETGLAFAGAALTCAPLLWYLLPHVGDGSLARASLVLGAAAAMTAAGNLARPDLAARLDEIVGVVGLLFLAAFFRPEPTGGSWALPGAGWLFVALGLGSTVGVLVHVILRRQATGPEFVAIALGSVAFTAGLAGYLALSPMVVCFVAGVVIANLPVAARDLLRQALEKLERPLYLVFLVVAGAALNVTDWRGWALAALFVIGRIAGLALGIRLTRSPAREELGDNLPRSAFAAPLSAVSIAVVVSARGLYEGPAIGWVMTAVIGGGAFLELTAQVARRARR